MFADFGGTTGLSDFPGSFIVIVLLSRIHDADPRRHGRGPSRGPPGFRTRGLSSLVRCLRACMGSKDPAGPAHPWLWGVLAWPSAFGNRLGVPDVDLSGLNGQPARTPVRRAHRGLSTLRR